VAPFPLPGPVLGASRPSPRCEQCCCLPGGRVGLACCCLPGGCRAVVAWCGSVLPSHLSCCLEMTCCDARSALLLGLHLPFPCMRVCTRALCYLSSCLPCSCSHLLFSSCRCRCRALYACQLSGTLPAALIDGRPGLNTLAVRCGVAGRHPRLVPCRRFSTLLSLPAALHFVLACLKTGVLPPACQSSLITSRCNLLVFAACLNPQCCLQHYAPLTPTMRSFNTTASMDVYLRAGRDQMCDQDQLCISQHLPLHAACLLLHGVSLLACMAVLPAHIH
jgi:hypothetical protein